jgi:hypothetical protein
MQCGRQEDAANMKGTNQNIVDRNVDNFHKESDKSHDQKAHRCGVDDLFELCMPEMGHGGNKLRKNYMRFLDTTFSHT